MAFSRSQSGTDYLSATGNPGCAMFVMGATASIPGLTGTMRALPIVLIFGAMLATRPRALHIRD